MCKSRTFHHNCNIQVFLKYFDYHSANFRQVQLYIIYVISYILVYVCLHEVLKMKIVLGAEKKMQKSQLVIFNNDFKIRPCQN